jgi:predicted  nucleic acid-binding Zn-ribbon protein
MLTVRRREVTTDLGRLREAIARRRVQLAAVGDEVELSILFDELAMLEAAEQNLAKELREMSGEE